MHIIGAKKGQQAAKPYIMPDNMQSGNEVGIVYGLGEGEILGLVDGGKSIYLDGTPLINDNGGENFGGVMWEMRTGTIDQEHLHGFPAVENETGVNVELRHDRAFVRQIRNTKLSAVVIRLGFGAIFTAKDNGDRVGHTIEYAIDVQTDGGVWREVLATKFSGKASQGYKRSHRIDLPTAKSNWTIRVRRITANKDSEMVGDRMTIDALTEVLDAKLRYPCTALIGLRFNAESFNNIPKFAAECHGMIIQVPSNYDPISRTYSGLWDGTFKPAYSNNPAWIYYDLCTARRYALGDRLIGHLDKWSLYRVAQYCDEMVDDGRGGLEPRYACNVYLQQREDAYKILQNIAGIFHALTYWDGEQIIVDADLPKDVLYTFSRANIIGDFEYSGTANYARHTQIKVAYDDPDNEYKTTYEIVPDLQAIAKYGVKTLDMSAFGCTSQAQAIRLGKWALLSEALETQTVTFSVGLDGYLPHVGSVIAVSDHVLAGRDNGGRVQAIDGNIITLDRAITKPLAAGDMLMINGNDGVTETRPITAINGNAITVQSVFERAEVDAVWAIDSTDLQTLKLRVMSIVQSEPAKFTITGVEYNPDKFAAAEIDIRALPKPVSVIPTAVISAPETVTISQSVRVEQGVSITKLSIDWSQVIGAVAYRVEWRKDDSDTWIALPKTASQSIDIDNVYSGNYQARVRAIDAFDNESLATSSQLTAIAGKVGRPPRPARLYAKGGLFSMELGWSFNAGSDDTNFTEIQVSPDGRANISTLGTFAYPTNKHEITGLQGNLTQHYRARIVDKLGNVSDWTDWTSGKTEAQADKVLNLLQGQITASQLHQDLSTPIGKIGTLETGLNTAKTDLSALNASMTTAKADIAKANTDLRTAVSNIATERNRISQAIADITALQSADNAKTAEIANLKQTVGGHTSSINSLAVTTGDLSQKYTQLKTISDTANSEITAIKQAQAGQATQISTLGSRFDSLSVGGRNLILGSAEFKDWRFNKSSSETARLPSASDGVLTIAGQTTSWKQAVHTLRSDVMTTGEMVLSADAKGDTSLRLFIRLRKTGQDGYTDVGSKSLPVSENWGRIKNVVTIPDGYDSYYVMLESHSIGTVQVRKVKLERGNIATDWSPAPEDVDAQFTQTNANISSLQQTLTNADNALSSRIDSLSSDYNSNKSSVASQLKTLSDKDTATASQITSLQANVTTAQSTANTANSKADTATTKADNAQATANNALSRANTANSAIATEQTARADADTALSQRITALDSAYKSADNALSARVATAEQSITTANQAIAQTQQTLTARFDSLSVGGRNLLVDSEFVNYLHWGVANSRITTATVGVNTLFRIDCTGLSGPTGITHSEASQISRVVEGLQYTLSLNVQGTAGIRATGLNYVYLMRKDGNNKQLETIPVTANISNRPSITFTAPWTSNQAYILIGISGDYAPNDWFAFYGVKLERGNVATDWTPAPEDVDSANQAALEQISQVKATADGLSAQYTVKVQTGGIVSGVGLMSSNGVSAFAVRADQFYIAPPTGTNKGVVPFTVQTTPRTVNGVSVPAGTYIDNAFIANGSIGNAHIANGAITTAKIGNAQIGNAQIANGAITTAKIGTAQVDTLQIAGQAVVIPRYQYNGANQTWYDVNKEIETNRITINPEGGSVVISVGFSAMFALPKGAYTLGEFTPVTTEDLHTFYNSQGWVSSSAEDCVVMRIKRGNHVIHEYFFTMNYLKKGQGVADGAEKTIVLYENLNTPSIVDNPPAEDSVYTLNFELRAKSRRRVYGDSDRTRRPQLHIQGLSFQALASKR